MKSKALRSVKDPERERGYGGIAQLGEHLLCKQGVIGSIPIISTKGYKGTRTTASEPETKSEEKD